MAENKRIAFEIEVLGHNKTVQNIAEVEVALDKVKQRRKELKKAYDDSGRLFGIFNSSEEFKQTQNTIV